MTSGRILLTTLGFGVAAVLAIAGCSTEHADSAVATAAGEGAAPGGGPDTAKVYIGNEQQPAVGEIFCLKVPDKDLYEVALFADEGAATVDLTLTEPVEVESVGITLTEDNYLNYIKENDEPLGGHATVTVSGKTYTVTGKGPIMFSGGEMREFSVEITCP